MTKLLQNKPLIKFLGIALSILLVVALVPQINVAYGSKDDVADEETAAETQTDGATDLATTGEIKEGEEASGETFVNEAGVEMVSHKIETPEDDSGDPDAAAAPAPAPQSDDPAADTPESPKAARAAASPNQALVNDTDHTIDGEVINTNGVLKYSQNKEFTLTVNGVLRSDIKVSGGAKLTIKGSGTIIGNGDDGQGSVIIVEGKADGTKLTFNGPTVTGGTGSVIPNVSKWTIWGKVGGGILVCRAKGATNTKVAALEFNSGTIQGNTANAGAGIFIDHRCGLTMTGGSILNNETKTWEGTPPQETFADGKAHEGGGIFFWGNWNGKSGNASANYGHITGGEIKNNVTNTTTDWGGGGVYVNNDGWLRIDSARITNNTAESLGGGIAGCPHAKIGIGHLDNGVAVFGNTANGNAGPANKGLKFNTPDSVTSSGKKVPSGDFLVMGLTKEEAQSLGGNENGIEYSGTTLKPGEYAKGKFNSTLASDYYCTRASFISATNLKDHPTKDGEAIAWEGFIAGIAADKVTNNTVTEFDAQNNATWTASEISIPANENYEVHDATLCLKSTATEDKSGIARSVVIEGNRSGTHGGGVSCNGTLEFGTYPQSDEVINDYTLSLNKKIVAGKDNQNIDLGANDRFSFTLTDTETNKTYTAKSNKRGEINFTALPGLKQSGTKHFVLKEIEAAGYESFPEEGLNVEVDLAVSKEMVKYGNLQKTTYTTTQSAVEISGQKTTDVTNTLKSTYEGFSLGLTKQILTTLDANLNLDGRTFNFALYDGDAKVAEGTSDNEGKTSLAVTNGDYAKQAYEETNGQKTFTFTLKETASAEDEFMKTIPDATVEVTLCATGARVEEDDHAAFLVSPKVEKVTVGGTDVTAQTTDITVTNRYTPNGTWQFVADKYFYGLGEPQGCTFTMVELAAAPIMGTSLSDAVVLDGKSWTAKLNPEAFVDGVSKVTFPAVDYRAEGSGPDQRNDIGEHYYRISENGAEGAYDTTAYVVKATVAVDEADPGKLVATEEVIGYADTLDSPFIAYTEKESTSEPVAFYNTDTYGMISAASYSVYAASGEPVDQVCYVDPKIIKKLEGRAIKSGEFAFKLIEVANYNDTEGTVISATTNDEFGMVDFDKANNVSGDLENPSCLAYTKPGTYYYRVIEDTSKGGMNDQSVLYSDQVITFTTVIEQDEATGRLVCTDMYYGYWDKAANKNVRYDEQYTDFDTQPGNIGDMSKLNPDWHPTITNKTRPMDLQVRKTSVSDRNEGLVGATYGLYMVNENAQGDIWLAEATSEDGGWITYKNVSLSTNNLYYFKETAAPAGHTVSEFRSSYFYLVEDASSANGYALQYADSKYLPEAAADEAAVQAEVSGTVQAKNAPAAQADTEAANEAAADTETQPGYSADGNVLLTYDKDGGVYDEVTTLEVNKLDTRTHEWVEGAKLVILEKESGKEIASWTSGKAPQKLEKTLNVGTTYLLREVEAPNQYRLANDVEFVIDDYGNVSITKGTENGNAELSDNTIALYDTMLDAEETETIEREKSTTEKPNKDTLLAKTGDMLPILGIALVALAALIVVIVAVRRRRAGEDSASNE